MKKLVALIVSVAMLFALAAPALANSSISKVEVNAEDVAVDAAVDTTGLAVVVDTEVENAQEDDAVVAEIIENVTDAAKSITPAETAEKLLDAQAGEESAEQTALKEELKAYDYASTFTKIALTDPSGEEIYTQANGDPIPVAITLAFDTLAGMEDPANIVNYALLVINPETHTFYKTDLDASNWVDQAAGSIKVELPSLGYIALICK